MYLRRLELQGFKTFAQKTVLEFTPTTHGQPKLTAVVGPNGSGKSNLADAIRWVMGEPSLKLLRAKKSEDIIFSGAPHKPRAGFAEVTMVILKPEAATNDGSTELELSEIVITRRLYRDGQSDYEINQQSARLADVTLLLAQCGVGQRTYSVIGQGMVDAVLTASPAERKEFFDEAAGLRVFQLKRQIALNKLEASRGHLSQAHLVMQEIEPRLSSLERQVKRLRERENLEQELRRLERQYFGQVWADVSGRIKAAMVTLQTAQITFTQHNGEAEKIERELLALEREAPISNKLRELRVTLDGLKEQHVKLREEQIRFESQQAIERVRNETPWSPLPIKKLIENVSAISALHTELHDIANQAQPDLQRLRRLIAQALTNSQKLLSNLQRPIEEDANDKSQDTQTHQASQSQTAAWTQSLNKLTQQMREKDDRLEALGAQEDAGRTHLFELQRRLSLERHAAQASERKVSDASVEVARLETRRDAVLEEVRTQTPTLEAELDKLTTSEVKLTAPLETVHARRLKLRSQLDWIGGIDPATLTEHAETAERFTKLQEQTQDLTQAITSLETILAELDTTIKERREAAFQKLNREFNAFFKKLFGGGEARLIQLKPTDLVEETEASDTLQTSANPLLRQEAIIGIDLQVTPPGKRLKSSAVLSGGERALTSIALICAIMATNPSPFVVLDEVDAALDEANSQKFAAILESLADKTQFVVITHNRATMAKAQQLYGITLGGDGVSQLLSLQLD